MNVIRNITARNRTVKASRTIKYIIIHWVGTVSSAEANSDYFKTEYRGASAHYFVDDDSIYQVVEDKDIAWAVGAKNYYHAVARNANSLNIEMCLDSVGHIADETIAKTAELVKSKMAEYNIPAGNVIRHYDVTHKLCPAPYVDASAWSELHARLTQARIAPETAKAENSAQTTETAQNDRKYKVGDMVRFNTCYRWPSDAMSQHIVAANSVGTIIRIADGLNPYCIGNADGTDRCWVNDGDIFALYNKVVARTTGTGVQIRKSPDGTIIGSLKKGTFVDVLDSYTNGWSRIQSGEVIAFISSQYLSNLQPSSVYR